MGLLTKVASWVSLTIFNGSQCLMGAFNKIDVTAIDLTKKEIAGFEDAISATLTVFSDPMSSHMFAMRVRSCC